jgi:signal transduction histidine kinase
MRKAARVWPQVALWGPVLVIGGLGLYEVWVDRILGGETFSGPRIVHTLGVLMLATALAIRVRAPGTALGLVLAELVLEWGYSDTGGPGVSTEWFVTMLFAFYSVGAHCELRPAVVRLALAVPVLLAIEIVNVVRGDSTPYESAGVYPFVFTLWGAGVAVRRMRERATRLEGRVDILARERDEKASAAASEERARIARELHDVIAHSVTTMVLQTSGARQVLRSDVDDADEALRSAELTGRQALRELRRLLGVMRTDARPSLDPQPGVADIAALVGQMRDAGLPIVLEARGAAVPVGPGLDLAAYRIVQEALTNVLKHAGGVETVVCIDYLADALELDIHNAESGRAARSNGGPGHGLLGMQERVGLYGGALRAGPDGGGGFRVHARLPLEGERV